MSRFVAEVDTRCQRGMHIRYTVEEVPAGFLDDVRARFGDRMLHRTEALGALLVHRVLLPFRFELKLGHRPGHISLILRFSSPDHQRQEDRAAFEDLLTRKLEAA